MVKYARIVGGGCGEKRRPVGPRRWGVRLWRLGDGVVEGVWPRAWDITFVLPKKRLERDVRGGFHCWGLGKKRKRMYRLSDNWVRTSLRYVFRMLLTLKT